MNKKKGFTLIELLVVIAIIGVLSSVVLASLNTARGRANDARRISDLKAIEIALALYYDNNGAYPIIPNFPIGDLFFGGVNSTRAQWATTLGSDLAPYLSSLPVDPINNRFPTRIWNATGGYAYYYKSDGQIYDLIAWFEQPNALDCSNKGYIFDNETMGFPGWCPGGIADFITYTPEARIYEVNDNQ